jgi:hypothetical protein
MDSLYNSNGATLAFLDLNLMICFFKYGFRINPDIIKVTNSRTVQPHEQCHVTKNQLEICATGLSREHASIRKLGGIKFDFANPIDKLKN